MKRGNTTIDLTQIEDAFAYAAPYAAAAASAPIIVLSDSDDEDDGGAAEQRGKPKIAAAAAATTTADEESSDDESSDDEDDYESAGSLHCKIVGVQYYRGKINNGECVSLVREPLNKYDKNAVRVENVLHLQVGHIERHVASVFAPVVDNGTVVLEAMVHEGSQRTYSIPAVVEVFARIGQVAAVRQHFAHHGLDLVPVHKEAASRRRPLRRSATEGKWKGQGRSLQGEEEEAGGRTRGSLGRFQSVAEALGEAIPTKKELESDLNKLFSATDASKPMPEIEAPPEIVTRMYPHQKKALWWMTQRESGACDDQLRLFWERRGETWYNIVTHTEVPQLPDPARGGILADDMGLGKTLSMIALVVHGLLVRHEAAPTLIVCPFSVLSVWANQFEAHVSEGAGIKVVVYHGSGRASKASQLLSCNVVITTYATLSSEYTGEFLEKKKKKRPKKKQAGDDEDEDEEDEPATPKKKRGKRASPLQEVSWQRIILDEAQAIKTPTTKQAVACCALKSQFRWCCSGTPIQNSLEDFFSLLKFLHVEPLSDHQWWRRLVASPLKAGDKVAFSRIQAITAGFCLRRTKNTIVDGKKIVELPSRSEFVQMVKFSDSERSIYDPLERAYKQFFKHMLDDGTVLKQYAHVLELLLRLRQVCSHPWLYLKTEAAVSDAAKGIEAIAEALKLISPDRLERMLSKDETNECCVCLDVLEHPLVMRCTHVFCQRCFDDMRERHITTCPLCREPLKQLASLEVVERLAREGMREEGNEDEGDGTEKKKEPKPFNPLESAKVVAMLALMERLKAEAGDERVKFVIFSQWTSFLDIISEALANAGWQHTRIDGSMTHTARDRAISLFQSSAPNSPPVIICSLHAAGLGLTLTAGSCCFIMDPWWNVAAEDQAVDRIHRLGQTKDVRAYKFIVSGTVEERIITLQQKKQQLAQGALTRNKTPEELQKMRLDDLRLLFS